MGLMCMNENKSKRTKTVGICHRNIALPDKRVCFDDIQMRTYSCAKGVRERGKEVWHRIVQRCKTVSEAVIRMCETPPVSVYWLAERI